MKPQTIISGNSMMRKLLVMVALCLAMGVVSAVIPGLDEYSNVTSMYINITPEMGTQTDYQIKFILSNASGISGYYAPNNVIFTNGTTRPDWYDINATDESNNPLPFWIENNTQTAKNATAWVKVPAINVENTSVGKWYYGNISQTESAMDGLNTFPLWDDFTPASAFNTTKWYTIPSTSIAQSGGIASFSAGSGGYGFNSTIFYGYNYTFRSRWYSSGETNYFDIGFKAGTVDAQRATMNYGGGRQYITMNGASSAATPHSNSYTSYSVWEVQRINGANSINFTYNDGAPALRNTYIPTVPLPADFVSRTDSGAKTTYVDWVVVRKMVATEPTTSLYTTTTNEVASIASFTSSPNPSTIGFPVSFTDTSTGSPTTWNWTFGDLDSGNTSTLKNPTRTYQTAGNYTVLLNVSNSTGAFSEYSHFQLVNPLSTGHVNDFQMFDASDKMRSYTIDPKDYVVTPGPDRSLWGMNMEVPQGSTGNFIVSQADGNTVSGTWTYTASWIPTQYNFITTIGGSSSTMTFTNLNPRNMHVQIWPSDNSSLGRGISLGYGQYKGWWNNVISEPVEDSVITRFEFHSDQDVVVTATDTTYEEATKAMLSGVPIVGGVLAQAFDWTQKIKEYSAVFWGIFLSGLYWLKFLFIENLVLSALLYITGTLAYCTLTSRDIFVVYRRWFKMQRDFFEFIYGSFNTLIQMIVTILRAIIPGK